MPKVTVIIPAYNAERFIRQAIDSVVVQTFRDFEILVIDDGSQDKTAEIAESYKNPVICFRKQNGGASSARNFGIINAQGEYIAFLDSDDLWEPTKLEKQVALLDANSDVGLCYVAVQRINKDSKPLGYIEANAYPDYCEALLLHSCIVTGSCSSAIMRRELFEQVGVFDTNFTNYEDWEYWLRLSLQTKFAPIPEYLVKCRIVSGSMSSNPNAVERDMAVILEKFFNSPDLPKKYKELKNKSYSNNWMIVSGEYLHAGEYVNSLRCLRKALRYYLPNIVRPLGLPWRWTKRFLTDKR